MAQSRCPHQQIKLAYSWVAAKNSSSVHKFRKGDKTDEQLFALQRPPSCMPIGHVVHLYVETGKQELPSAMPPTTRM